MTLMKTVSPHCLHGDTCFLRRALDTLKPTRKGKECVCTKGKMKGFRWVVLSRSSASPFRTPAKSVSSPWDFTIAFAYLQLSGPFRRSWSPSPLLKTPETPTAPCWGLWLLVFISSENYLPPPTHFGVKVQGMNYIIVSESTL